MATVWKTRLEDVPMQEIYVPDGAELLCAREQGNDVVVWFRCDPQRALKPVKIASVQTGKPCPEEGKYLGTALLDGGQYVLHVFQVKG